VTPYFSPTIERRNYYGLWW